MRFSAPFLLFAVLGNALPQLEPRNGWTTVCSTVFATLTAPLESLPTSSTLLIPTSTVTSTVTPTAYVTITASQASPTLTKTVTVTGNPTVTVTYTSQEFELITTTIGTATLTYTICINSNPATTSTVYIGGDVATDVFPAEVDCTTIFDWPETVTFTETSTTFISTITSALISQSYITAITVTRTGSSTSTEVSSATTTITQTSYAAASSTTTISTSCPATLTKTQSSVCAPTNLIDRTKNGYAIEAWAPTYPGYGTALFDLHAVNDASGCCQLCQENEGCAAMVASPPAFNYWLVMAEAREANGTSCGLALTYTDRGQRNPGGEGALVQVGCGGVAEDEGVMLDLKACFREADLYSRA
ncbi:MAG: hypothetical protein Q9160_008117 [Pyrenula sp. 1 TL-2023]